MLSQEFIYDLDNLLVPDKLSYERGFNMAGHEQLMEHVEIPEIS